MSLCQCLTQCICVNVLLLQFDIIKLFICIGKIVTNKMFSCIHELSPYHYQLSSCHHQLSSWYILTCILDIYLDTISLNNYNQIDYALDLSPLNLTCCSQGQSRNKKLALSQSTRSPSGFHYFAKSSIFAKYIGHHGFRVSVSACMFFPFVRLQRLYRPHGLSDRPDSFGSRYIQFMGPCSIFTFLYRVKFKVKVTTFVKI